jgi:large subunit ribosomal protein L6
MEFNIKKLFFKIDNNIFIKISNNVVYLKNKYDNNYLEYIFPTSFYLYLDTLNNSIYIINDNLDKFSKILYTLHKKLFLNKVKSLLNSFEKTIVLNGIGYKFILEEKVLKCHFGYSKCINIKIPNTIKVILESPVQIKVFCKDNIILGNFCYTIKSIRKFDIYKGKGAKFYNEKILLKETKKKK